MSAQEYRRRVLYALAGRPRGSKGLQWEYIKATAQCLTERDNIMEKHNNTVEDNIDTFRVSLRLEEAAKWFDRACWVEDRVRSAWMKSEGARCLREAVAMLDQSPARTDHPPARDPATPSDQPCAEVNPVLWAYFSRVTGRNGDPSAVWSEADVVQCLDARSPARLTVV